jgi:small basic protein
MIYIFAGILGILAGLVVPYNLNSSALIYMAVAIVAALDSVFGALLASLNKKFNLNVFMMGLFSNAILAMLLTWMGDLLSINLYFAAIVVFGVRIFNNMASIRRITADMYFERRAKEKERIARLALKAAEPEQSEEPAEDKSV